MHKDIELELLVQIFSNVPIPTDEKIKSVIESERLANPHNDFYKPKRRSYKEIRNDIWVTDAEEIFKELKNRIHNA